MFERRQTAPANPGTKAGAVAASFFLRPIDGSDAPPTKARRAAQKTLHALTDRLRAGERLSPQQRRLARRLFDEAYGADLSRVLRIRDSLVAGRLLTTSQRLHALRLFDQVLSDLVDETRIKRVQLFLIDRADGTEEVCIAGIGRCQYQRLVSVDNDDFNRMYPAAQRLAQRGQVRLVQFSKRKNLGTL